MNDIFQALAIVAALGFLFWLFIVPVKSGGQSSSAETESAPIDVDDPHQLGILIGMTGGSITDAAIARYALQRFEETHGRKATLRDAATVVGLMQNI